jgi:hypothetical protein
MPIPVALNNVNGSYRFGQDCEKKNNTCPSVPPYGFVGTSKSTKDLAFSAFEATTTRTRVAARPGP